MKELRLRGKERVPGATDRASRARNTASTWLLYTELKEDSKTLRKKVKLPTVWQPYLSLISLFIIRVFPSAWLHNGKPKFGLH